MRPSQPPPADCAFDPNNPVTSYHLQTECIENPEPLVERRARGLGLQRSHRAKRCNAERICLHRRTRCAHNDPPFYDTDGIRAMGYYDGSDLNYYYFMASNFATSDRLFNPAMTRTHPNREYLIAATSRRIRLSRGNRRSGFDATQADYDFSGTAGCGHHLEDLRGPDGSGCSGPPYAASCLIGLSYISNFTFANTIVSQYPQNIAPISQYFTDLQNGTLPQVAQIEPATDAGLDEHPSDSDTLRTTSSRERHYVQSLIDGLMQSSSWKDSAFILT